MKRRIDSILVFHGDQGTDVQRRRVRRFHEGERNQLRPCKSPNQVEGVPERRILSVEGHVAQIIPYSAVQFTTYEALKTVRAPSRWPCRISKQSGSLRIISVAQDVLGRGKLEHTVAAHSGRMCRERIRRYVFTHTAHPFRFSPRAHLSTLPLSLNIPARPCSITDIHRNSVNRHAQAIRPQGRGCDRDRIEHCPVLVGRGASDGIGSGFGDLGDDQEGV